MAIRTYLIFKENGKEVLNTQIFGNNFWDDTFFTEISKLVGKDCFPECEEPDGEEVEVPFEEVFKLMEDVLVREIEQYQLDLIEAIQETEDGEVSVVQLPIELIATSTLYK